MKAAKWIGLLVVLGLLLPAGTPANALDEEGICAANGGTWNHWSYQCYLLASGTTPAGIDYHYQVAFPTRIVYSPLIQFAMQQVVQTRITEFMTFVNGETVIPPGPLTLDMDFEIFFLDPTVFSVAFYEGSYTGGAHPNADVHTVTIDAAHNRVLQLEDLFVTGSNPLAVIAPVVIADLQASLGSDPSMLQWIQDGTGTNFNNYRDFVITNDALIFFFAPYQVAPYAAGGQSARVPLSQLAGIWNPTVGGAP